MADKIALLCLKASIISCAASGPTFVFSTFSSTCFILSFDLNASAKTFKPWPVIFEFSWKIYRVNI